MLTFYKAPGSVSDILQPCIRAERPFEKERKSTALIKAFVSGSKGESGRGETHIIHNDKAMMEASLRTRVSDLWSDSQRSRCQGEAD